jgi:hypothetical protein
MPPPKAYRDYATFIEPYVVGNGWEALEDFDCPELCKLQGFARDEALTLLRRRLEAGNDDPRIVRALVAMNAPELTSILRKFIHGDNQTGVAAAYALYGRTKDPAAADALRKIAGSSTEETVRLSAAGALRLHGL